MSINPEIIKIITAKEFNVPLMVMNSAHRGHKSCVPRYMAIKVIREKFPDMTYEKTASYFGYDDRLRRDNSTIRNAVARAEDFMIIKDGFKRKYENIMKSLEKDLGKLRVGIDPDVHKSGFAIFDTKDKQLVEATTLTFWKLTERLLDLKSSTIDLVVVVEAGWLNAKSNFHSHPMQSKTLGERIAKNVGANHQVGKLLVEFCRHNNIDCEERVPKTSKIPKNIFKQMTGMTVKNQDVIDACMLIWEQK